MEFHARVNINIGTFCHSLILKFSIFIRHERDSFLQEKMNLTPEVKWPPQNADIITTPGDGKCQQGIIHLIPPIARKLSGGV